VSVAPLLDTHAWIWWVDRDRRLGTHFLDRLDNLPAEDRPSISDISLWEVATLVARRRLRFQIPFREWLDNAAHPRTVRVIPISTAVAEEIAALPESFHHDPADRVIVATCRALKLPLLTRHRLILRSQLVSRWTPGR